MNLEANAATRGTSARSDQPEPQATTGSSSTKTMSTRKYTIGIDPDLHDLSIGVWDHDGPVTAYVVHLKRETGLEREEAVDRMVREFQRFIEMGLHLPDLEDRHAEPEVIVMEGQSLKRRGKAQHRRPDDIVRLAQVAAQCLGMLRIVFDSLATSFAFPDPERWKGSVAKHAMQARLYKALGWGYTIIGTGDNKYARPVNPPASFNHISKGQWKHVGDALLLAKWGYESV